MEKEKFRCHPSIIIEKLAIFFLVIIFLIIYNFDDARMLIEGGMTLKRIVIRINNIRNKSEEIKCVIKEMYERHFIVETNDSLKRSFNYADILTGNIELL